MPRDTRHEHDVVVVAKSRDVYRGSVRAAIAAGVRPAIYGSGWEQFVDRSLIVSDYVANDELAAVYSSAGVVLNDHWDDMRSNGFVSNRIFDALACVAPVISDDMPEIRELFGDTVLTYRDGELRALVDCTLADRDAATRRAERGRKIVVAGHTFDHRARQFVDALLRHGLHPNP
jgi:spore maturation protein CgeB